MKLTLGDLEDKLNQQLRLIYSSINNFDNGMHDEALHLATRLRVLLYDNNNKRIGQGSLLGQLGLKNNIQFIDTALEIPENKYLSSYHGLSLTFMGEKKGVREVPILDNSGNFKKVDFETWWNGIIFIDMHQKEFSRKDIILFVSEQDGGAHVDGKIQQKYENLTRKNGLGIKVGNGEKWEDVKGFEYIAIRQITHELLKSIDNKYKCDNNWGDEAGYLIGGNISIGLNNVDTNILNNEIIYRKRPCFCGSGKKYKRCCGNKKSSK